MRRIDRKAGLRRLAAAHVALALLGFTVACGAYRNWKYSELRDTASRLLAAVSRGDSASFASLTTSSTPVDRLVTMRHQDPEYVSTAKRDLDVEAARIDNDTASAIFSFVYRTRKETMSMKFVKGPKGRGWRVTAVGFPSRI